MELLKSFMYYIKIFVSGKKAWRSSLNEEVGRVMTHCVENLKVEGARLLTTVE